MRILLFIITALIINICIGALVASLVFWSYFKWKKNPAQKKWLTLAYVFLAALVVSYSFLFFQDTTFYDSLWPEVNWSQAK